MLSLLMKVTGHLLKNYTAREYKATKFFVLHDDEYFTFKIIWNFDCRQAMLLQFENGIYNCEKYLSY